MILDFQLFVSPTSMVYSQHSLRLQCVHTAARFSFLCCQYAVSLSMSHPANNQCAFWTDEKIDALLKHLLSCQSENEGAGGFSKSTFQSAIPAVKPFCKRGAIKNIKHIKQKWQSVCLSHY